MRVIHIPNSGWPGCPRNVGIDAAVGEYVQFVDQDDELGDEALQRMYDYAKANDSDVVVGKEGRRGMVWNTGPLFARNRPNATLEDDPALLLLLTPHKMFRRAFLREHDIRFPEGRRRLEDHAFVMTAYFRARVISVLADYTCYYRHLRPATCDLRPATCDLRARDGASCVPTTSVTSARPWTWSRSTPSPALSGTVCCPTGIAPRG